MFFYEYVFLVCQDVLVQQVEVFVEQYKGLIEGVGGIVGKVENWGLWFFVYCIKKNWKVYYMLMNIEVLYVVVVEMECQMGLFEDVLCFMIFKVDVYDDELFVMMQKCDCDDCGGCGGCFGDCGGDCGGCGGDCGVECVLCWVEGE